MTKPQLLWLLWRAWQTPVLGGHCYESPYPVRVTGCVEFEIEPGKWVQGVPAGVVPRADLDGQKPGQIEWIGPGSGPGKESPLPEKHPPKKKKKTGAPKVRLDLCCPLCTGDGNRLYANTGTYRTRPGGIYGQAMTPDVCDRCWGSGDDKKPFSDLRRLNDEVCSLRLEVESMKAALNDCVGVMLHGAGDHSNPAWQVKNDMTLLTARALAGL